MGKHSLFEYLNYTLDQKLSKDLYYVEKKTRGYKKLINRITKKYPEIVNSLINNQQIGGDGGAKTKVEQIKKVIDEYNKLSSTAQSTSEHSEKLKELIAEIVNKIDDIKNTAEIDTEGALNMKPADYSNIIETVRTVLNGGPELYELNKLRGQIQLKPFGEYKTKEYTTIFIALETLKTKIETAKRDYDKDQITYQQKLEEFKNPKPHFNWNFCTK